MHLTCNIIAPEPGIRDETNSGESYKVRYGVIDENEKASLQKFADSQCQDIVSLLTKSLDILRFYSRTGFLENAQLQHKHKKTALKKLLSRNSNHSQKRYWMTAKGKNKVK
jgi:hypothetical protein